jgi:hypothetical protein
MGRHNRTRRTPERQYSERMYSSHDTGPERAKDWPSERSPFRRSRFLIVGAALVALVVWSGLAWMVYALADPLLGWLAANLGVLIDSGRNVATAVGGSEVGGLAGPLDMESLGGQLIAWLRVLLKPAILLVWALGALIIAATPLVLPRILRLLAERRF